MTDKAIVLKHESKSGNEKVEDHQYPPLPIDYRLDDEKITLEFG
jgi:hypothetical protein